MSHDRDVVLKPLQQTEFDECILSEREQKHYFDSDEDGNDLHIMPSAEYVELRDNYISVVNKLKDNENNNEIEEHLSIMCKFIAVEDLVANALIELYENNDCKRVSFEQLMKYGINVVKFFRDKNEEAVLLVSKDYVNEMLVNYSNFFEIEKNNDEEYVVLNENKTAEDLRNHFRAYLTLDELFAFISEEALSELGVVE